MRAKTINEAQNFERGIDPKDSMNIGNPQIRKINTSLRKIQDVVSSGFSVEEMDFPDIIGSIDNLKGCVLLVIINYFKKNFGWDFKSVSEELTDDLSMRADIGKGYELRIKLSNTLMSYTLSLYTNNNYIGSMPASTNLNTLDKKAKEIIKKYLK